MALSDEKIMILKMVQDGKITSEEAAKLLEALESGAKQAGAENTARQQRQAPPQANYYDEINKVREKVNEWRKEFKGSYNQKDFDKAVEEFAEKAEKIGRNVAATTVGIVDKMVDFVGSFVDTNVFNIFGSYTAVDKVFEAPIAAGMKLEVEGINGHILVKKHAEDKVIIKSRVRSPINNADSILVFKNDGDSLSMKINKIGNISVAHEVFLPDVEFKKIVLETTNAKIYAEDSKAEKFECSTRNAHIDLMGVNSEKISLSTKNAKIGISYVAGREIDINTNNSVIDIKHIKAQKLKAVTMNGRILVENVQNYQGYSDMSLYLKTSNGGIKVNMNDVDNRGYKVNAKTTSGGINLLIPNMVYLNESRQGANVSFAEAESTGYANYPEKAYIEAETHNGLIEIVK